MQGLHHRTWLIRTIYAPEESPYSCRARISCVSAAGNSDPTAQISHAPALNDATVNLICTVAHCRIWVNVDLCCRFANPELMCSVGLMIRLNQDKTVTTLDVKEVKLYNYHC